MVYGLVRCHYNNDDALFFGEGGGGVCLTNVTNVTAHAVVFSQRQASQNHHQHQRQTSYNDQRHRFFLHKNDKRHNVTMFGVMMSYFCFEHIHINYVSMAERLAC